MLELTLVAMPLAIGAVGYLLRRWLERRAKNEALRRKLQTLSLYQGMKRTGLSVAELDQLEREVTK